MTRRPAKPKAVPLGEAVSEFLARRGLAGRIHQASAVDDWAGAVGAQIAGVTEAVAITPDGTLFVSVKTHAWMTELSLLEPELVRALNAREGPRRVHRIRFQLQR